MDTIKSNGSKSISQAVEDGTLIDVSEMAKQAGLKCRTFLDSCFWDKGLGRSDETLRSMLDMFAGLYTFVFDYNHLGPIHADGVPDITEDKYEGYCTGILEPNAEFGLSLVIMGCRTEDESDLLRTTGNSGEYAH